jgi:hypothetical protein
VKLQTGNRNVAVGTPAVDSKLQTLLNVVRIITNGKKKEEE